MDLLSRYSCSVGPAAASFARSCSEGMVKLRIVGSIGCHPVAIAKGASSSNLMQALANHGFKFGTCGHVNVNCGSIHKWQKKN